MEHARDHETMRSARVVEPATPRSAPVAFGRPGGRGPGPELSWVVFGLCAAALFTATSLWVPLVLSVWTAVLARPFNERLARMLHGRTRAASAVTALLVVLVLLPIVVVLATVADALVDLVHGLRNSTDRLGAVRKILTGVPPGASLDLTSTKQLGPFLEQYGAATWKALTVVGGTVAGVAMSVFVYAFGVHVLLVDGPRAWAWTLRHSPLARADMQRLGSAFVETGRGIIVGFGLTAVAQSVTLTTAYIAAGVPEPALLGVISFVAAFVPAVGIALVWVPLTAALAVSHRTGAALAIGAVGLFVSSADNWLRPMLSRYGHLDLPFFVLLVAMLGGAATFGASGILLGPILVRVSIEGLKIVRERRVDAIRARRGSAAR